MPHERQKRGKNRLDRRLDGRLYLGVHPVVRLSFSGQECAGGVRDRLDLHCRNVCRIFCSLAISIDTVLEADACTLFHVFSVHSVGRMVIRWPGVFRADLVESVVVPSSFVSIRESESEKMGRFQRSAKHGRGCARSALRRRGQTSEPAAYRLLKERQQS